MPRAQSRRPVAVAVAVALALAAGACTAAPRVPVTPLRAACAPTEHWSGSACVQRGDGAAQIARGQEALASQDVDLARAPLAAAERGGPLDHRSHILLYELRGIAAAYEGNEPAARSAFERLLVLDPSHFLSYTLSPKATFVFERVRDELAARRAPTIDVRWPSGLAVGEPLPLDIEVVADPAGFLARASLFVRTRGEPTWRAADIALDPARPAHVVLPAVAAAQAVSLELHLRAYDQHGNEVLAWAAPEQPRELPLRYDPPPPWYRQWWAIGIAGTVVALGTGVTVYALVIAPPSKVDGTVTEE